MSRRTFRVLDCVGTGGCGRVYRAELRGEQGFTKLVALKVLSEESELENEELACRLRDEARILGLLRHRAVVHVDGLVHTGAGWAVVMEYVDGVDLTKLERTEPPVRVVLEILEEVASALDAAWSQPQESGQPLQMVHRDIKPPNIRITPRGEVKLLDFGVATANFQQREAETRSLMLGTLKFMAPERLDGVDGPPGDIYSLGLVAARLLLGRSLPVPPRREETHLEFLRGLRNELAERVAHEHEAAAAPVTRMVLRMLCFQHEARPDAAAVASKCRELIRRIDGPWLRDWAPARVAPIQAQMASIDDHLVGRDLEETRVRTAGDDLATRANAQGGVPPALIDFPPAPSASESMPTAPQERTDAHPTPPAAPVLKPKEPIPIISLDTLSSKSVVLPDAPRDSRSDTAVVVAFASLCMCLVLLGAYSLQVRSTVAANRVQQPEPGQAAVINTALPAVEDADADVVPAHPAADQSHGQVLVDGPDYGLALVAPDGERIRPGVVAAGSYTIEATFGAKAQSAGHVEVGEGQSVTLRCLPTVRQCRRQK